MKVKAAVVREAHGLFTIEDLNLEKPREDEILVKVIATGVCHTDIVVRDGMLPTPLPVVLGHEGAGIVECVGSAVKKVSVGDHVVMTFNSCGTCPSCEEHEPSYCHEFFPRNFFASREDGSSALSKGDDTIHGNFFGQSSFATHSICHERNIVKVSKKAPLEILGPLACGIQTGAGAVINALKVKVGKTFAVFGTGSVGLAAIMAANAIGATTIIAIDMNEDRLNFALEIGATHILNPKNVDVTEEIMKITTYGLDYVLDTTGISEVIKGAVLSLAPRGTCGILGASAPGSEIVLDEVHFMSGGRKLIGIVEGETNPDTFIPMLISMYQKGSFPFDKMIKFYPLEKINEAIADSESGTTIKPIIKISNI